VTFKKRKVLDTPVEAVTAAVAAEERTDYVTSESKVVDGADGEQVVAVDVATITVKKIGSARNFRRKSGDL
jgi:hypothetical protein